MSCCELGNQSLVLRFSKRIEHRARKLAKCYEKQKIDLKTKEVKLQHKV